jgi:hypothetical protein
MLYAKLKLTQHGREKYMPLTRGQHQPRIDQQGNNWEQVFQRFDGTIDEPFEILNVPASAVVSNRYIDAHLSGSERRIMKAIDLEGYWARMFMNVDCLIEEMFDELDIFFSSVPQEEEWYQELRDTIWNSPNANRPEEELYANTPEKLLRMQVLEMSTLTAPSHQTYAPTEQQKRLFKATLDKLGIDVAASRRAIDDLITYGPADWHSEVFLDVVWRGKFEEAVPSDEERTLTIEDPTLSMIDTLNGFHWDVKVIGSIQVTIGTVSDDQELPRSKRAYLDPRHHQIES